MVKRSPLYKKQLQVCGSMILHFLFLCLAIIQPAYADTQTCIDKLIPKLRNFVTERSGGIFNGLRAGNNLPNVLFTNTAIDKSEAEELLKDKSMNFLPVTDLIEVRQGNFKLALTNDPDDVKRDLLVIADPEGYNSSSIYFVGWSVPKEIVAYQSGNVILVKITELPYEREVEDWRPNYAPPSADIHFRKIEFHQ